MDGAIQNPPTSETTIMTNSEISADLNAIMARIDRLNTLAAGVLGEYNITLEPELTLTREGNPLSVQGDLVQYLDQRIAEIQQSLLRNRFQFFCFDILKQADVERIAHELEPLTSLYAMGFDPGSCAALHLCRESAAYQLLFMLLHETPLLQLHDDDGSIKVQLPGALIVALEKYVRH